MGKSKRIFASAGNKDLKLDPLSPASLASTRSGSRQSFADWDVQSVPSTPLPRESPSYDEDRKLEQLAALKRELNSLTVDSARFCSKWKLQSANETSQQMWSIVRHSALS